MGHRTTLLSILYPLLLACYPALHLLAANSGQIPLTAATRSLALALLLAAVLLGTWLLLLRNLPRAALLTAITLLFLLSYGHVYDGLKVAGLSGATIVRHRYLLPLWGFLFLGLAGAALRLRPSSRLTSALALLTLALVALPLARIGLAEAQARASRLQAPEGPSCSLPPLGGAPAPDVYLIIMDSYERADVLQEMHGFDNRPFLDALRQRGFYIADGSLSNYRFTELSLASMLNLDFIQNYSDLYSEDARFSWAIAGMINDNRLRHELECAGYLTVAIDSGVFWTNWDDADVFLSPGSSPFSDLRMMGGVSDFEGILLDSTLARAPLDTIRQQRASEIPASLDPATEHRSLILFEFEQLSQAARLPAPKFVYAHVLAPHPPNVFGPNGEPRSRGTFADTDASGGASPEAYADEVAYLNTLLLGAVDRILQGSSTTPVIVIMGDHGRFDRGHEDELSILNAILLPGGHGDVLYPTITPVNTFRVVLDEYLGGSFGLLPDASYYSGRTHMFHFEQIPNTWSPEDSP
jgi:hypothetical protein